MDPHCLVSPFQAGRNGRVPVWGICSLQPARVLLLTLSIPSWLQCTYLSVAASIHKIHHAATLRSFQTGLVNMKNMTRLKWLPQSPDCNPKEHLWNVDSQFAASVWCYQVRMDQNLFWRQNGRGHTSKVSIKKWPASKHFRFFPSLNFMKHWFFY